MKLYKYTCGMEEKYGPAENEQDAYERRDQVDPIYHILPVVIAEVKIPGYEIGLQPVVAEDPPADDEPEDFAAMDADQLRAWLDQREIKYHSQYGEKKLRELCISKLEEENQ
jgi:hypothetical protein